MKDNCLYKISDQQFTKVRGDMTTWTNLYKTNVDHKPKVHVVTSLESAVCTVNSCVLSNAVFTTTTGVYSEQLCCSP